MTSPKILQRALAAGLFATLLLLAPSLTPAWASSEGDRAAIRSAVEHQIEAFRHDDAAAAFDLASPAIRQQFGTQDRFFEMVKTLYKPVYRPRTFTFGDTRDTPAGLDQAVRIQDESGVDWDAIYSFEREADGTWKISGCRLVKAPGEAV